MASTGNERALSELFRDPPAEYRSRPFWAWNGRLDPQQLTAQIDDMKAMGYGGFHIHSRIGLETEYLGPEFMACVRACHRHAREIGMQTCLYDEDKWPSGFGAGRVTASPEFRMRHLLLTRDRLPDGVVRRPPRKGLRMNRDGEARLLAQYRIRLEGGNLLDYRRVLPPDRDAEDTWFVYRVVAADQPWFNNAAYVDVLNPKAIERFIETSYEPYARLFGSPFPADVPVMFTDEPEMFSWLRFADGADPDEAAAAFTEDLPERFRARTGRDLLDVLPELFWNWADGRPSEMRWQYFDLLSERFCASYAGTLGPWCETHGIRLTGHLMEESTLEGQSRTCGDAMRSYADYDLPGIDILADRREYSTALQLRSVQRQLGKAGAVCECFGVTNWDYTFARRKLQGDWLMAMGVTHLVPHLVWMRMGGEAKRDYPSPLDGHAPWHTQNGVLEDYFARLNVILRRGKAAPRVAMLHPVESQWLAFGPAAQSAGAERRLESQFQTLTQALLFGLVDFDYLSEGLMKDRPPMIEDGRLRMGEMAYEAVIVPPMLTLRAQTLDCLNRFLDGGGRVICVGAPARFVDARPADGAAELAKRAEKADSTDALLAMLEPFKPLRIEVRGEDVRSDLAARLIEDHDCRWLFVCHASQQPPEVMDISVEIHGRYAVTLYDAMAGKTRAVDFDATGDVTRVPWRLYREDALLLRLDPIKEAQRRHHECEDQPAAETIIPEIRGFSLAEPNALVIDRAEYRLDDGPWQPGDEILKLDCAVRGRLGLRQRSDSFPQPWLQPSGSSKEHTVSLRARIPSGIELESVDLAWEGDADVGIRWNGEAVDPRPRAWYVDRAIHLTPLGRLICGENLLELTIPFGEATNLENLFLLGAFGVRVEGARAWIDKAPKTIAYGDATGQGLAFYGGSIDDELAFDAPEGRAEVELPAFSAPLASVALDDGESIPVFLSPRRAALGEIGAGAHRLRVRCWGSRINQFGQLHNDGPRTQYFGPASWRPGCGWWTEDYQLRPTGLIEPPVVRIFCGKKQMPKAGDCAII